MLKNYDELRKIDVRPFCEEREGFLYLNWARCIELLHQNGAEIVYFTPVPNNITGSSLIESSATFKDGKGNTNKCYETLIEVHIDDKVYMMQSPVMNGKNPVKDNSMNQNRVWSSMCRSFVKCVAINTGLGFDLWLKEEAGTLTNYIPEQEQKATNAQIKTIKDIGEKHVLNLEEWIKNNNKTWETLTEKDAAQMLNTLKSKYGDE
ncbi:MAG: DUF1071 domain-containing protein [Anaerostipes sp.]|jgi:hypothetical protein|nr:DUF1071 domain-containing protein [Anaerostipes sp.]